ncbi:MAG: hypothetical protein IFK92_05050 [Acidobacteria bacterium]|nr:hypothetical protein [Candidatus Sulfomarinibacter kjeldsenii]
MEFISVFNDVLGPVMRGPSSSHTAGAYRIGLIVRGLLAEGPTSVRVTFDPEGSMAPTYRPLGVDLAFTAGLMVEVGASALFASTTGQWISTAKPAW